LYRHATLARQLVLSVQDLLTAIDLTGLNPFDANQSQNSLQFVAVVTSIQDSGFAIAQLDYILRQRAETSSPFVLTDAVLAQTLTDIRTELLKLNADPAAGEKKKPAVIDRVAAALALPADVAGSVLGRVTHSGKTGLE